MLYAAKCYWPGITETELEQLAARAEQAGSRASRDGVDYLGSLLFSDDDLVLCPSRAAVKQTSERAGIPCESVVDSVWLDARRRIRKGTKQ